MGFDAFFTPNGFSSGDRHSSRTSQERPQSGRPAEPLIPMGDSLGGGQDGLDGLVRSGTPPSLDRELATLEALRRSQAELEQKSGRFQASSPEAQYLFVMAQTLVEEDIPRREQNITNIFGYTPSSPYSKARSLI